MTVKLSALAVFLLVGALAHCTHARAAPSNNVLEADSDIARRNLVCVELQRFQLGGPGCGGGLQSSANAAGEDEPRTAGSATATPLLTRRQMQKVCPVLCRNQVGSASCACRFMQPNWVAPMPDRSINVNDVCGAFCAQSVPLGGCNCGPVSLERVLPKIRPVIRADSAATTATTEAVETTTEPDWGNVCLALCQIGEGGALCNCDKPPFVK